MAIKGISDVRRLPRLGKIKTGEKRVKLDANGKPKLNKRGEPITYPVALDYFVVPDEVKAVYGEKPTELEIMFPLNDEDIIFPQDMKKYGATGLHCKGDGEVGYMSVNGELVQRSCDPDDEWCKDCQPRATLNVLLPEVPGFGVWQITTGSWNSIVNINSQITAIKAMTGGRIAYIPLKLRIVPHNATVVTNGKQFKKVVYVLRLDIAEKFSEFYAKYGRKQVEVPPHIQRALDGFAAIGRQALPGTQAATVTIEPEEPEEIYQDPEPELEPPEVSSPPQRKQPEQGANNGNGAARTNSQALNGNQPNWTAFWMATKELGLDREQVHEEAKQYFMVAELQSLKDVARTQDALDDFLGYLRGVYGG